MYVVWDTCHCMLVGAEGQPVGVGSLVLPCGYWDQTQAIKFDGASTFTH